MRLTLLAAAMILLAGCYGSIPPEPPCLESPTPDGVKTEARIRRDLSRRPREVWNVRQDSSGSWIRHGRSIRYFLNGQASAIEWYKDGKLDGEATYWHENGAQQGRISYTNGLPEGPARTWYDDGRIESERTWKNGRPAGLERWYDRRGAISRERIWPAPSDSGKAGK